MVRAVQLYVCALLWFSMLLLSYGVTKFNHNKFNHYHGKYYICGTIVSLVRDNNWGQAFQFRTSSISGIKLKRNWYIFSNKHYPWYQGGYKWCFDVIAKSTARYGVSAKIIGNYSKHGHAWIYVILHLRHRMAFLMQHCGLARSDLAFFLSTVFNLYR